MKKRRARFSFVGYIIYFFAIAALVAAVFIVYRLFGKVWSAAAVGWTMFASILVLALACTLIDYFWRKLTVEKTVKKIFDATDRIASGDFSVRMEPSHGYTRYNAYDEIMENLNRMAAELSKTEVLRSDFIANVSHEIKTPLAVIRNYASALCDDRLPEDVKKECAEAVSAAAERLSALVTNVLKLNKLEHQQIFPVKKETDLGEAVRRSVLEFEDAAKKKGVSFECDIDDVSALADEGFLEIICNNLLSNAVKFTPEGGTVSISLKKSGEYAVLKVRDTGCGMTAETGAHIFDKFYQGDASHAQEGNGLGLALVKKAIDVIGGEITVESEPKKGSCFTVRLKTEI